ncbi:hypothetical protein [Massilia sp. NR 4-1]|uniref:hypothetical protein n=1 Tax=Massilia sp. NR 4-1 TaxID=1678028 RepID=UPI00067D90ED|nr:hypothetical protein [Massilia sp. NR 4-1]AKU20878.1 hypothetical protein ACZ75_04575 [Massilia sp. NR 4-1]
MRSKYIARGLIFMLLVNFGWTAKAASPPATEFVSLYSSWKMYAETGDCGGYTLTLIQGRKRQIMRGYLQAYAGNCEDTQTPIENIQLRGKHATLSFTAPVYAQDGKGGLQIFANWKFSALSQKIE